MNEQQRLHIELLVVRMSMAAKRAVEIEAATCDAKAMREDLLSASRRWIILADTLACHGRRFVTDLSAAIQKVDQSSEAFDMFEAAVEEYLVHLDELYSGKWDKTSPWRGTTTMIPPHWFEPRHEIELDVELQRFAFSEEAEGTPERPMIATANALPASARPTLPSDLGGSVYAQYEPLVHVADDLTAAIHPRYIGGPQVQDMPAVHKMAALLRAKEAKSVNKAATTIVEANDEDAKAYRLSNMSSSAVKRISEIYRMHYDDDGYPYGYSGPRPA